MVELLVAVIIMVGAPIATFMVCENVVRFFGVCRRLSPLTRDTVVRDAVVHDTVTTTMHDTVVTPRVVTVSDAGWKIDRIEEMMAQFRKLNQQYHDTGLRGRQWKQMNELKQKILAKVAKIKATVRV